MRWSDPPTSQINQSYQTRLTTKNGTWKNSRLTHEKWDAEKFTINARLKILTRLMLNCVNRRVNAINPAVLLKIVGKQPKNRALGLFDSAIQS